jgi:hypothetical protein
MPASKSKQELWVLLTRHTTGSAEPSAYIALHALRDEMVVKVSDLEQQAMDQVRSAWSTRLGY